MADELPADELPADELPILPVSFTVTEGPGETARLPVTFSIAVATLPVTVHVPLERHLRVRFVAAGKIELDLPVTLLVPPPEPPPPPPQPDDYNLLTMLQEGPYTTINFTKIRSGVPVYELNQKSGPDNVSFYTNPDGVRRPDPETLTAPQIPITPQFDDLMQVGLGLDTGNPDPEEPFTPPGSFYNPTNVVLSVSETIYEYDRLCPERLLRKERIARERVPVLTVMSPSPEGAVMVCSSLVTLEREIITQKWGQDGLPNSAGAVASRGMLTRRNTVHAQTEPVVVPEDPELRFGWPTPSRCQLQNAIRDYGNGERDSIPIYHWFYADISGDAFRPARLPGGGGTNNSGQNGPNQDTGGNIPLGSGDFYEEPPQEMWDPDAPPIEWIDVSNRNSSVNLRPLADDPAPPATNDTAAKEVPSTLRIDLTAESWQVLPQGLYYYRRAEYKTKDMYVSETSLDAESSSSGLYVGTAISRTGFFSRAAQSLYSEVNDTPPAIANCSRTTEIPEEPGTPDGGEEPPPQPDKPEAARPEWEPEDPLDEEREPEDNWIILPPSGNAPSNNNNAIVDDMRNMDSIRGTPITQEVDPDPGVQSQQVTSPLFSPMIPEEYPAVFGLALIGQQEAANAMRPATLTMTEVLPAPIAFEWTPDVARVQIVAQQNFQITIQRETLEETGVIPEI